MNSALTYLSLPHEDRVIRTALKFRGKHDLIGTNNRMGNQNSQAGMFKSAYNGRQNHFDGGHSYSVPLNDPNALIIKQERNRQKWQQILIHKEENMHKKHSQMKAMLAKSFKKEKEMEKKQAEDREMLMYKLEDKHERFDKVKTNKKALDSQFNIKMNGVSKKYNEKQMQVEKNRSEFTNQKRNLTVEHSGSNAALDYPLNRTATAS